MYWQLRSEIGLILQQFYKFSVFGLCLILRVDADVSRLRHSFIPTWRVLLSVAENVAEGETGTFLLHCFPPLSLHVGAL